MARLIRHFLDSQNGTAAIEYSLIAALITLAIVVVVGGAADEVVAMWDSNNGKMGEAFQ